MPDYGGMKPIYQYYVDAVRGRAEAQQAQLNVRLGALKAGLELYGLEQQLQEQQIARQIWGDQQDRQQTPGTFDPKAAGGATPNANPATGSDPALQTADRMDAMGRALAQVNPLKASEWFTKASTVRDQYYTRIKGRIEIQSKQTDAVGKLFGSVKDQEGYTNSLMELHDQGIDITKFGLTGNFEVDQAKLQQIAQGTLTYKDKLNAQHQQVTEQQAALNYQERVRHDQADEGIGRAKVGVAEAGLNLRQEWQREDLNFKARADARAAAGVERRDEVDLQKTKDFVLRPGKQDKAYADSLVASDPQLSQLSKDQKAAASAEIQLRARAALANKVRKPGDTPSADEYLGEASRAAKQVAKRMTSAPRKLFGVTVGSTPSLGPLPAAIGSKAEFDQLPIGGQFSKGGKLYKKTGKADFEEID